MDPCHADWAAFLVSRWDGDGVHRVLDLCCGSGLMTAELVSLGLDVVGLDASEAMLARARTLLGPHVPLVHAFLPSLPVEGPFDAVVSTLDGLNYLALPELQTTFIGLGALLRPGGWLVFDLHAEPLLDLLAANPVISGTEAGTDFTLTSTVDLATRACVTTITTSGPSAITETHTQIVHSPDSVRSALLDAGFTIESVTDEYSNEPVSDRTLRATWVARRLPVS